MDIPWEGLTVSGLKMKCEERGLPKSGLKADLLNRLREHDERFPARLPPPEAQPPRRHADRYRPQYENGFGQGRSPGNVQHGAGTTRQQPEGYVQRDQQQSQTESELEQICRDSYLPYESDRGGTVRKAEILTEYDMRSEDAKQKRDVSISKAETKYKNDMAKLDKDIEQKLNQLDDEVAPKREKQKNWGKAFPQLRVGNCCLRVKFIMLTKSRVSELQEGSRPSRLTLLHAPMDLHRCLLLHSLVPVPIRTRCRWLHLLLRHRLLSRPVSSARLPIPHWDQALQMLQLCGIATVKTHSSMPPELLMPEWMLTLSRSEND